jgi:hypothetical protein
MLDPVSAVHLADRYPRLPTASLPERTVSPAHIELA